MPLAIALVVIVVAAVLFNFLSPWWFTEPASNWGSIDDATNLTLAITGLVFIVINLFLAYMVVRFRYDANRRAAFEPDNKKLEKWLIGVTSVAIMVMLAPGLWVYSEFVTPPKDAMILEVVGKQWQWHFRFPGSDGILGKTSAANTNNENPFGISPDDANGQDDILIEGSELHLPLNKPVKLLLRSQDVLHDFYVPQIRAKMDLVPGSITTFWFTPTREGKFEILCAELCGVGHYNMRSTMLIQPPQAFEKWLKGHVTFLQSQQKIEQLRAQADDGGATLSENELRNLGEKLATTKGCRACHSVDGSASIGPGWKNLLGKKETLTTGASVVVDEAFLRESIVNPNATIIQGYPAIMPALKLSKQELNGLLVYIKSQSTVLEE